MTGSAVIDDPHLWPDDGAVVSGQPGKDRQDGIEGGGPVCHGGRPLLWLAPDQARVSAGLMLPVPSGPASVQSAAFASRKSWCETPPVHDPGWLGPAPTHTMVTTCRPASASAVGDDFALGAGSVPMRPARGRQPGRV